MVPIGLVTRASIDSLSQTPSKSHSFSKTSAHSGRQSLNSLVKGRRSNGEIIPIKFWGDPCSCLRLVVNPTNPRDPNAF